MSQEQFVLAGVTGGVDGRVDGRRHEHEFRMTSIVFSDRPGQVVVSQGNTRVSCSVLGELTTPATERPNEGRLMFNVEMTPIASPAFEAFRPSPEAVTLSNFVERALRGSKAVDTDALCVLAGKSAWSLRADIKVLNDDGNSTDVACLAALLALGTFRKEISDQREPVPLALHHLPIVSTFSVVNGRPLADPCCAEEKVGNCFSIVANQHGELCGIHKPGGAPINMEILDECFQLAVSHARHISDLVQKEITNFNIKRQTQLTHNVHRKFNPNDLILVNPIYSMDI
jgi:exosome complex component RRP45